MNRLSIQEQQIFQTDTFYAQSDDSTEELKTATHCWGIKCSRMQPIQHLSTMQEAPHKRPRLDLKRIREKFPSSRKTSRSPRISRIAGRGKEGRGARRRLVISPCHGACPCPGFGQRTTRAPPRRGSDSATATARPRARSSPAPAAPVAAPRRRHRGRSGSRRDRRRASTRRRCVGATFRATRGGEHEGTAGRCFAIGGGFGAL